MSDSNIAHRTEISALLRKMAEEVEDGHTVAVGFWTVGSDGKYAFQYRFLVGANIGAMALAQTMLDTKFKVDLLNGAIR